MSKLYAISIILFLITCNAYSQEKYKVNQYADLSLEELMDLSEENNKNKTEGFDDLLSTSVLTYEEIANSGVTSIAEALRLIPGVIVREMTNGNFDVHLRGLDNVPPNSDFVSSANTTTSLLIDGQPYYNYMQGGVLWSALPIDLHDIEKIEVVRGGSSSLYGPNAVSGTINIFTKRYEREGLSAFGEMTYGTDNTIINRASVNFNNGKGLNINVSGYNQTRDRGQDDYFNILDGQSFNIDILQALGSGISGLSDDPLLATENGAASINSSYKWQNNRRMSLGMSYQSSAVQSTYTSQTFTPLTLNTSETLNLNYTVNWDNWLGNISFQTGTQTTGAAEFDLDNFDFQIERNIRWKKFTFRPGASYRSAYYEDNSLPGDRLLTNGERLSNIALHAWLYYDILPKNKLRLLTGVRWDQFNSPDDNYFSYQAIISYQPNENNHIRFVNSLSYRSPFLYNQFTNTIGVQRINNDSLSLNLAFQTIGNEAMDLMSSQLFEVGWRSTIGFKSSLDLEIFHSINTDFSRPIRSATDTVFIDDRPVISIPSTFQNDDTKAFQTGLTASYSYRTPKLIIRPFITYQITHLENYSPFSNDETANNLLNNSDPEEDNINQTTDEDHEGTPTVYGGFDFNYKMNAKWNWNVNAYYFSENTFYHNSNVFINDGVAGVGRIDEKLVLNTRLSFSPKKSLTVYGVVKNILGNDSVEYYGNDAISRSLFFGLNFKL